MSSPPQQNGAPTSSHHQGSRSEEKTNHTILGAEGELLIRQQLSTNNPKQAIETIQTELGSLDRVSPTVSTILELTDLLDIQRSSVYNGLMNQLMQGFVSFLNSGSAAVTTVEEQLKLLEQVFPYIGFEELRPLCFYLLKQLGSNIPNEYLAQLNNNTEIFESLPIEIKRLLWENETEVFRKHIFSLLNDYLQDYSSEFHTMDCFGLEIFDLKKKRQDNVILLEILNDIGNSTKLYNSILHYCRVLFTNTSNYAFCNFRYDLLMMFHDHSKEDLYKQDPCYYVTWWLDAWFRAMDHLISQQRYILLQQQHILSLASPSTTIMPSLQPQHHHHPSTGISATTTSTAAASNNLISSSATAGIASSSSSVASLSSIAPSSSGAPAALSHLSLGSGSPTTLPSMVNNLNSPSMFESNISVSSHVEEQLVEILIKRLKDLRNHICSIEKGSSTWGDLSMVVANPVVSHTLVKHLFLILEKMCNTTPTSSTSQPAKKKRKTTKVTKKSLHHLLNNPPLPSATTTKKLKKKTTKKKSTSDTSAASTVTTAEKREEHSSAPSPTSTSGSATGSSAATTSSVLTAEEYDEDVEEVLKSEENEQDIAIHLLTRLVLLGSFSKQILKKEKGYHLPIYQLHYLLLNFYPYLQDIFQTQQIINEEDEEMDEKIKDDDLQQSEGSREEQNSSSMSATAAAANGSNSSASGGESKKLRVKLSFGKKVLSQLTVLMNDNMLVKKLMLFTVLRLLNKRDINKFNEMFTFLFLKNFSKGSTASSSSSNSSPQILQEDNFNFVVFKEEYFFIHSLISECIRFYKYHFAHIFDNQLELQQQQQTQQQPEKREQSGSSASGAATSAAASASGSSATDVHSNLRAEYEQIDIMIRTVVIDKYLVKIGNMIVEEKIAKQTLSKDKLSILENIIVELTRFLKDLSLMLIKMQQKLKLTSTNQILADCFKFVYQTLKTLQSFINETMNISPRIEEVLKHFKWTQDLILKNIRKQSSAGLPPSNNPSSSNAPTSSST